jgi:hypothetical protein
MNDTDMGMNTPNAINALNMGHYVRRKGWNEGVSIRKTQDQTWVVVEGKLREPFTFYDADIYATDWEIA